jgi:REP element-mobilizing transposase RayT
LALVISWHLAPLGTWHVLCVTRNRYFSVLDWDKVRLGAVDAPLRPIAEAYLARHENASAAKAGDMVMQWWCFSDAMVMQWWCCSDAMVMLW